MSYKKEKVDAMPYKEEMPDAQEKSNSNIRRAYVMVVGMQTLTKALNSPSVSILEDSFSTIITSIREMNRQLNICLSNMTASDREMFNRIQGWI